MRDLVLACDLRWPARELQHLAGIAGGLQQPEHHRRLIRRDPGGGLFRCPERLLRGPKNDGVSPIRYCSASFDSRGG